MFGKKISSLSFVSLHLTEHVSLKSLRSREDKIAEWTAIYNVTLYNVIIAVYSISIEITNKGTHSLDQLQ